ncbi:MAG: shikimate kinase [Acidimicrobiia bacterium]|nr:shikimate kinase [Acidimicrobiia bacterium]
MVDFRDRNIVLTGFMGTGKSAVGRRLAKRLGFEWIDTDRLIEERHGSIPTIFSRAGESAFRGIERNLAAELSERTRHVISTGGRMLLDPVNIRAFSRHGRILCLTADPEVLIARLQRSPTPRPLLETADPEAEIRRLLEERRVGYTRFAQITSDDGPVDDVVDDLQELVEAPTETPTGRRGFAVLGDAISGLAEPVTVLTDPVVGELFAPCLGPTDTVLDSVPDPLPTGPLVFLGGTSIIGRAVPGSVVVPTTPSAMDSSHDESCRIIIDLATLQTLEQS